ALDLTLLKTFTNWIKMESTDQVQNGTDQNSCDIFVNNLFEEAQKVGAVCTQQAKVKSQADTTIKLWKNGFTVNDGELRSYTDVANQRFLDSIKKGELPPELQKICGKEEVAVKVDDKKHEVYTLKKPVFHPFSGQGYRLGSATPRVIYKVKRDVEEIEKKKPTVVLNYSEPITNMILISHVRDFITHQGQHGRSPFTLTTSLPFRELLNESLTLEEANLKNAVIVQRLKKTTEPFKGLS
uniref:UBX domain protein 2A n=1 Tax=Anolis carolinensis TaxID=28377 RepID=A0A803TTC4_ANOCA